MNIPPKTPRAYLGQQCANSELTIMQKMHIANSALGQSFNYGEFAIIRISVNRTSHIGACRPMCKVCTLLCLLSAVSSNLCSQDGNCPTVVGQLSG